MSEAPTILRRADGRSVAVDVPPLKTNRRLHVPTRIVSLDGRTPNGTNSLAASSAVLTGRKVKRATRALQPGNDKNRAWQEEAWYYWEITGALRYATRYEAAAMSRARLVAKRKSNESGAAPVTLDRDHPVSQIVENLLGGPAGQARALEAISTHLYVAGISYLVGYVDEDGDEIWHAVTPDEVTITADQVLLKLSDVGKAIELPRATTITIRVWTPHPRRHWEPDSTVRGAFTELRELQGLAQHVAATIDSRLTGAGLLLVPQEMSFVSNRTDLADDQDPFIVEFIETAMAAREDRDSAAAMVPLVLKVPGIYLDKIQHVTFSTDFDERVPDLRKGAMSRLAMALDIPAELLEGMGDASFRTAWGIEEAAIKMHFEPKLDRIAAGLTSGLLLPGIEGLLKTGDVTLDELGISDISQISEFLVGHDTTALKLRPNRAEDAESLHNDLLITDEARRRTAGFSEDEAPEIGSDEWIVMVLRRAIVEQPQFSDLILPIIGQILNNEVLMSITPVTGTDGRRDDGNSNTGDPAAQGTPVDESNG